MDIFKDVCLLLLYHLFAGPNKLLPLLLLLLKVGIYLHYDLNVRHTPEAGIVNQTPVDHTVVDGSKLAIGHQIIFELWYTGWQTH